MAKVSVVIPVYNGERFLEETLRYVMSSDYDDFDVVVLDNASTDATPQILARWSQDPRVRVERNNEVLPLPQNWIRATELAAGDYIKVVCADDLIRRDALRRQATLLDQDPTLAVVASQRYYIDEDSRVLSYDTGLVGLIGRHTAADVARITVNVGINPIGESATLMFRRADYEAVGGWDPSLVFPMDIDLWQRLLDRGDLYGIAEAMSAFRISSTQLSSRHDGEQHGEQAAYTARIAADPRWSRKTLPRPLSAAAVAVGWLGWSVRDALWRSALIGAPRRLGEPRPLIRGMTLTRLRAALARSGLHGADRRG